MAQDNDVSRRDFVKTAGAVTAVAAALPAVQGAPAIQKVRAANDQVQIRTQDRDLLKLQIGDHTAVTLNGQTASPSQLQPGSDVRASYQMVDGKANALKIDATSKSSSSQSDQQK